MNAEIEAINTDVTAFADLLGDTSVGKTIASLSAISDPQKITDLATLKNAETTRLTELDKTLAESYANDAMNNAHASWTEHEQQMQQQQAQQQAAAAEAQKKQPAPAAKGPVKYQCPSSGKIFQVTPPAQRPFDVACPWCRTTVRISR